MGDREVRLPVHGEHKEAYYKEILDHLPAYVCRVEVSSLRFLFGNRAFLAFYGVDEEALLGMSLLDLTAEFAREQVEAHFAEIAHTAESHTFFHQSKRADGVRRWCKWTEVPITNEDGEVSEVQIIGTDVTKKKEQEHILKSVMEADPSFIYIYSLEKQANILLNRDMTESLGYSKQEIREMGDSFLAKLMHPEDFAKLPAHYERLLAGADDEVHSLTYRMKDKEGEWRWLWSREVPFRRNEQGEVLELLGSAVDITEQKEIELNNDMLYSELVHTNAELLRVNEELEARVEARTLSLAKANEELLRSNKELEQFAYAASHDLREPLNTISNFTRLLRSRYYESFDETGKKFLHFLDDASQRQKRLISALLDYSRIRANRMEWEEVSLREVADDVLWDLRSFLEGQEAEVRVEGDATLLGSHTMMRQMLMNFVSNAAKFRREEAPVIDIVLRESESECTILIKDNGIGIEEEFFDQIFLIYRRLHTQDDFQGTGLGLALCRKIAELHKGTISIASQPGVGSTFTVILPKLEEPL